MRGIWSLQPFVLEVNLSSNFGVKIMSVHQRNDGHWIVVFKSVDGKRKERSFECGPDAEASAKVFDEAMRSRDIVPVAPLRAELKTSGATS